mgnify:CR=1 FL=1
MADKRLQCIVVTPERTVVDEAVDFVAVPLYDGEVGGLPGRAPLIARTGCGELRTHGGGQTRRYYVDGGFVQVRGQAVTVLTPRASKAAEIDPHKVDENLATALAQAGNNSDAALAARSRATAQKRVAARASQ